MQPQLGMWKRFIRSLLRVDRCSLSWASGRGLLEVYQVWTDASLAGDQEEGWAEGSSVCGAGWWEGLQTSLIVTIARYWVPCWYCNEFCLVPLVSCTSWWHVFGQCYQYLWDNSCPSRACQMYGTQGFTLHNCSSVLKVVMQCWTWMPYIQWAWECMYSVSYWNSSRWHILDQETFACL